MGVAYCTGTMKHTLPELPFSKDALEPNISAETIDIHYRKHHQGYVDKLNELIKDTPYREMSLLEIVTKSDGAIFNNAAQAWNHTFYWNSLTPEKYLPQGALLQAIGSAFGGLAPFTEAFTKAAAGQFGSGWAWLVKKSGSLAIETTSNADNPLRSGRGVPLLTLDVWEHAYYIDYRNERALYLNSVSKILNWKFAERQFSAA